MKILLTRFQAVKCNPDPQVLRLLAGLGTGFDCASKAEIEQVLSIGVDPSRIIYAQPCKTKSYIRYAANVGVKQMTFDNADELYKVSHNISFNMEQLANRPFRSNNSVPMQSFSSAS